MICREQDEKFVMIKQYDHGLLAGAWSPGGLRRSTAIRRKRR
ncbi:DUF3891 family protein [Paenibacillus sophorae]|uniref:DUF3891 family protein n=1 Tax=Paenibacillus sophorae TaxID=1333845 RepID=A0ABX8HBL0_9BACL|nr:DUF3891 family protein [Paenibacillus sophorae]QWU15287.1 DUF3891 family protein [Paenibacillus sophorae]